MKRVMRRDIIRKNLIIGSSFVKTFFLLKINFNLLRTRLPAPMIDRSQISIWSILKQFIGKVKKLIRFNQTHTKFINYQIGIIKNCNASCMV